MIEFVHGHWTEGERHGIPRCCRARYLLDPMTWGWLPTIVARLFQLSPRRSLADGIVPCEGHVVWWALTGRRPVPIEDRNSSDTCCEARAAMAEQGGITIEDDTIEPENIEGYDALEVMKVPSLHIDGEPLISVSFCPWCGAPV